MSELALRPTIATPLSTIDIAVELMHGYRWGIGDWPTRPALCTLLAQSALETWRWKAMWCWNFGNVKATNTVDPYYFKACTELLAPAAAKLLLDNPPIGDDGQPSIRFVRKNKEGQTDAKGRSLETWTVEFRPPHRACAFRGFDTVEEGAEFYIKFLARKYAPAWPALVAGDPSAFVDALKANHYFTADLAEYKAAVVSLYKEFLKLDFVLPSEEGIVQPLNDIGRAAIDAAVAANLNALSWRLIDDDFAA